MAEPDLVERLQTRVVTIIRERTGLHDYLARPIADDILQAMRRNLGGERVYIPERARAERAELYALIAREYDGTNRDALCRRHHISRRTFYRAVRRERLPADER